MPEALKSVNIVYYIDFLCRKKYEAEAIEGCHRFVSHSGGAVLRCEENVFLLRPLHIIKAWQREQSKMGFLSLTMNEFGIKNVHGYIKKIKSAPSSLFSTHGKIVKAGMVTGRFVRHVADVRKYQFKNRTTGKIITVLSTPNHPFYVKNRGTFIPVEAISALDQMIQKDGQIVEMVHPHPARGRLQAGQDMISVYNLEVSQKHTYFVGDDSILVHNPYVCTKKTSSADRYYALKSNKFVKNIEDPSDNNVMKVGIIVKREDKDRFVQVLQELETAEDSKNMEGSKNMEHRKKTVKNNLDKSLRYLGFRSITKKHGRSIAGPGASVWVLKKRISQTDFEKRLLKNLSEGSALSSSSSLSLSRTSSVPTFFPPYPTFSVPAFVQPPSSSPDCVFVPPIRVSCIVGPPHFGTPNSLPPPGS